MTEAARALLDRLNSWGEAGCKECPCEDVFVEAARTVEALLDVYEAAKKVDRNYVRARDGWEYDTAGFMNDDRALGDARLALCRAIDHAKLIIEEE